MKYCINCHFSKKEFIQVGNQMGAQFVCEHNQCGDPVVGTPMPCNYARKDDNFCGLKGKYFKQKEEPKPAPVIEMVK